MRWPWISRKQHEKFIGDLTETFAATMAAMQKELEAAREPKYAVCQFYSDGKYTYACRGVTLEQAADIFSVIADSPSARIGTTTRIILTDSEDNITTEWLYGRGITYRE